MTNKSPDLEMYRKVLTVKVKKIPSGIEGGVFDIDSLDTGVCQPVMGVHLHSWEDGKTTPCYMLIDNEGVMRPFAMSHFVVHEVEERSTE